MRQLKIGDTITAEGLARTDRRWTILTEPSYHFNVTWGRTMTCFVLDIRNGKVSRWCYDTLHTVLLDKE